MEKSNEVSLKEATKPHQGKNARWFRKQKGYSQEYVALKLKCTQQYISECERMEMLPEDMIPQLAEFLEIGITWLTDTILDTNSRNYSQEGTGNFLIDSDIANNNYNVHHPLDTVERIYKETFERLESNYMENKVFYTDMIAKKDKEIEKLNERLAILQDKMIDKI